LLYVVRATASCMAHDKSSAIHLSFARQNRTITDYLVRDQGVGGSNPLSPTNLLFSAPSLAGYEHCWHGKVHLLVDFSGLQDTPCINLLFRIRNLRRRHGLP